MLTVIIPGASMALSIYSRNKPGRSPDVNYMEYDKKMMYNCMLLRIEKI